MGDVSPASGHTSSWRWMAPEALGGTCRPRDTRADVYSFGMLMFEVFAQRLPFDDIYPKCDPDSIGPLDALRIQAGQRPDLGFILPGIYDIEAMELMQACWTGNVDERPNLDDVGENLELFQN